MSKLMKDKHFMVLGVVTATTIPGNLVVLCTLAIVHLFFYSCVHQRVTISHDNYNIKHGFHTEEGVP